MPQDFTLNDFSGGWQPSNDAAKGAPNALLKMDNVKLDKNGAISLMGGTNVKYGGFSANAHTLFSRSVSGTRHEYSLLTDGTIYRDGSSIATGGDSTNGACGTAFNFTLICSGAKRVKDSGSGTPVNLGVLPPTAAPGVALATRLNAPYALIGTIISATVTPVGASAVVGTYLQMTATAGTAVVQSFGLAGAPFNCNLLQGVGGAANVGYATEDDIVLFQGYTAAPAGCSLKFDVLLVAGDGAGNPVTDYYTYVVDDMGTLTYDAYTGVFTLKIKRSDFQRIGAGVQDWSTVYGYRVTFTGPAGAILNVLASYVSGGPFYFFGGSKSQNGQYQYMQVNVNNTGSYIAKSVIGPISNPISIEDNQFIITPQDPTVIDAQCNEAWIFRRGGQLGDWYRIKVFTTAGGYAAAYDTMGDQDALTLDITFNINLVSIASSSISDKIYDIVGPIEGRWYYFTVNMMYPSDINDPDLVDASLAVRTTGSASELFMWARKVSEAVVLVGTSVDVYVLTGTFQTLPDFSVDVYYRSLSCKFPPITYDADTYAGQVFYMANDGLRSLNQNGQNPLLVSPRLDLLYSGETRYGYTAPNLKIIPGAARFPIVIAKNKLWCFLTGTNRCDVFDFMRQYWFTFNYGLGDVTACYGTQDGFVIGFYGTDKKLREIDISTSKLIDGVTKQTFTLLFPITDMQAPRQRKDMYTIKARIYTGGNDNVTLSLTDENNTTTSIGTVVSPTTILDKFLTLAGTAAALIKTMQVTVTGQVADLLLEDINLSYDLRPIQVTHLHILSENYGTTARKRLYTVPFQIDTLGNNVTLTPTADGIGQTPLTINSVYKKSFDYQFVASGTDILRARDYDYIFDSTGLFEFFGFQQPRNIEIFPEEALSYVIPVTNFGNANKKRLRVWPFLLNCKGGNVTFIPLVDGVATASTIFTNTDFDTVFHFFKTDVFGVDYSGIFISTTPFELKEVMQPDIVQVLPIARRFDQVGPQELFKYGKIKQFEYRVLAFGTSIPYKIYFNDVVIESGAITTVSGLEGTYFIDMPKTVAGNVLRIEFGPTDFDFHRQYVRVQAALSGADTELQWVNV